MKIGSLALVLLVGIVVAGGCRKNSTPPPAPAPPVGSESPPQLTNVVGGNTPLAEVKYFKGSIGSTLDLQMKLIRSGDQLSGSYFYQRIGSRINLRGKIEPDGHFVLDEFDQAGKQTGIFKGLWTVDAQDGLIRLAGNWSKPPNEKGSDKMTAFSVHEEPIALSGDVELTSKQIKESNKKLMYEIAAQYPQFSGGSNPNFEKFNQLVRGIVTKEVTQFKKDVQPEEGEERPEGSMGSDISIGYEVGLAQDNLVSIQFDVGSYFQGAAHPNSYTEVVNYDLKNGKQLNLSDLFKPGSKYLQAIATYAIADLKKQSKEKGNELPDDLIQSGAGPSAKNYRSWKITRKGLGINFDPYQVGPYAAGAHYVLVPYANLKDAINPDGPIGQFAK
jgi:hypothetical protein